MLVICLRLCKTTGTRSNYPGSIFELSLLNNLWRNTSIPLVAEYRALEPVSPRLAASAPERLWWPYRR